MEVRHNDFIKTLLTEGPLEVAGTIRNLDITFLVVVWQHGAVTVTNSVCVEAVALHFSFFFD